MLGTGAQVATGVFFGILPVIGTSIGALYDEFFGDKETIKYLEVFPIKGDKVRYTLNPTANIKKLNTDFRNFQKKYIQKAIDEDINKINIKINKKINFSLLFNKNNSLHKKIKIEQPRKETSAK